MKSEVDRKKSYVDLMESYVDLAGGSAQSGGNGAQTPLKSGVRRSMKEMIQPVMTMRQSPTKITQT